MSRYIVYFKKYFSIDIHKTDIFGWANCKIKCELLSLILWSTEIALDIMLHKNRLGDYETESLWGKDKLNKLYVKRFISSRMWSAMARSNSIFSGAVYLGMEQRDHKLQP